MTDAVNGAHLYAVGQSISGLQNDGLEWNGTLEAYDASHASGSPQKFTNVAPGTVSATSTEAVNGAQLYSTDQKVQNVDSNVFAISSNVNAVSVDLTNITNGSAGVIQRTTTPDQVALTSNGGTAANPGNPQVLGNVAAGQAATDAVNVGQLRLAIANVSGAGPLNVRYAAGPNGEPTNVLPLVGDGSGAPVKITNVAPGRADTDAANFGQVKNAVTYDTDGSGKRSGTITLAGPAGQAVRLANVAPGIAGGDAVNVGQLRQAQAEAQTYTDTQVDRARSDARAYTDAEVGALRDSTSAALNMLGGQIRAVRTEARSGVAAAMAMGAAPMPADPGSLTLALQSATFGGELAMGGSMAYRLDTNIPVALTAGASGSRGNVGLRAGVLIVFK